MIAFVVRRVGRSALVLLALSLAVFIGVYAVGDPTSFLIDPTSSPAEVQAVRHDFGLDRPLIVQYGAFLAHVVRGDFGVSFVHRVPAMQLIFERLPATVELAAAALALATLAGIPLGLLAAVQRGRWIDRAVVVCSTLAFSFPTFWVGLLLVMAFAVALHWLPASGRGATVAVLGIPVSAVTADGLRHLALPALNLSLLPMALLARLTRANVGEVLQRDFVRTARAKGVPEARVLVVHVLRNAAPALLTVGGIELGTLIAFSVVTESIFAWPGTGRLVVDAINQLDRPVVVAYLLVVAVFFTAINLAVDLLYVALDPRVRLDADAA